MTRLRKKTDALSVEKFRYKARASYFYTAKHFNDEFKNLGYNYRGQIFKKTTSPELWANPLQIPFYGQFEALIVFLIEQVKMIKKTFSIAHENDSLNIM